LTQEGGADTLTMTAAAPTDVNAAALSLGSTYANNNALDINEDGTNEYFSVVLDVDSNSLQDFFQYWKYVFRRGNVAGTEADSLNEEEYKGIEVYIDYDALTLSVNEGDVVTQLNTLATGTVIAHHTTPKILSLRNVRGTFDSSSNVEVDGSNYVTISQAPRLVNTVTSMAHGVFSGGKFTGAPGVALINVLAGDLNNYTLTDDEGNSIAASLKVPVTVTNTRAADWIGVFELTNTFALGGIIDKAFDTVGAGAQNATTFVSTSAIVAQVIGKSTGGTLFHVDDSTNREFRYRFTSWTASTFTLFNVTGRTSSGGSTTTLIDTGEDFGSDGVLVGDIIQVTGTNEYGYITDVATDTLTITSVGSHNYPSTWNAVAYEIGTTVETNESGVDTYYVPIIHVYETTGDDGSPGTENESVVYTVDIPAYFVARQSVGSFLIETFTQELTVGSTGTSPQVIRNDDNIIS